MAKVKRTKVLVVSKVKEILRLKELGLNQSQIAIGSGVCRSTVQDYLRRADAHEVKITDVESCTEEELLSMLGKKTLSSKRKAEADYSYISRELSRKGVTLSLLWEEYIVQHPGGISYSGYCYNYRQWKKTSRLSMKQVHKAGEKLFVDYAGHTVAINEPGTGKVLFHAQIFVAVLGASNYTYVEATRDQKLQHWIGSHQRCFEYLGGVPQAVVPDNLKSGVTSPSYYDPQLNPTYKDLAKHYKVAVIPARVRKPKDKSKVEVGVQIVERWILAALRNRKFFSLDDLNREICKLLEKINSKQMKSYGCSRKELFESIDKPALRTLPSRPYEFFDFKLARVNIDYHVEVEKHYYSVPYLLVHKEVEIRIKERVIDVLCEGKRVALHIRSDKRFHHSTKKEHMPPSHQAMLEWTPTRFINWAAKVGPQTKLQIEALLNSRAHPEQSYRACLGLLRLEKRVSSVRLEAACQRANHLGVTSFRRIKSILDSGMDRVPIVEIKEVPVIQHRNLRGGGYYH